MHIRDTKRELNVADRKAPSFSSSLLDEIYRSIDDGSARESRSSERDRAQKWMEKMKKKKSVTDKMQPESVDMKKNTKNTSLKKMEDVDNDALFFSSGSNSSDSNSSLFSDHESTQTPISNPNPLPTTKTKTSCFLPPKPKPIRTSVKTSTKTEDVEEHVPASTKSRALKMYAHLKKMKQPISPGMKLTALINSILPNSKSKRGAPASSNFERSTKPTTCSSATSFSRSYKNQQTPSVQTETEQSRMRSLLNLKRDEQEKLSYETRAAAVEDDASDCSDDLFEIDHLRVRFTMTDGELPVHETTRVKSIKAGK